MPQKGQTLKIQPAVTFMSIWNYPKTQQKMTKFNLQTTNPTKPC
jgi:hypothetical protein